MEGNKEKVKNTTENENGKAEERRNDVKEKRNDFKETFLAIRNGAVAKKNFMKKINELDQLAMNLKLKKEFLNLVVTQMDKGEKSIVFNNSDKDKETNCLKEYSEYFGNGFVIDKTGVRIEMESNISEQQIAVYDNLVAALKKEKVPMFCLKFREIVYNTCSQGMLVEELDEIFDKLQKNFVNLYIHRERVTPNYNLQMTFEWHPVVIISEKEK